MLDFTSSLYLGLRHPHAALTPWTGLTTGRPAALQPAAEALAAQRELAVLFGCERVTLATSTLHLYFDLFESLAREPAAICFDAGLYPVARIGVERAAAQGVPAESFAAHEPSALERALVRHARRRVIVATNGFCVETGRPAPLAAYLERVRAHGGYLVVDDTQALGVLGGAGTAAFQGVHGPELILGSSLAKGFGAPLAALAGAAPAIAAFEDRSQARVHSSPPSLAAIAAARRALALDAQFGDALRQRLAERVARFRERLRRIGEAALGGLFPFQTLKHRPGLDPPSLYRRLLAEGVRAVLRARPEPPGSALSFLITASHSLADVEQGVAALQRAIAALRRESARAA